MLEDPVWFVPPEPKAYGALAGTIMAADAPSNPIRRRWLGFDGLIGIHGTRAGPLGIGSSDGCVLMCETDVIDLYSRVHCGVPVIVT
jgi:lipoprotein-anchoring transpeptidase ErfK/SrfK